MSALAFDGPYITTCYEEGSLRNDVITVHNSNNLRKIGSISILVDEPRPDTAAILELWVKTGYRRKGIGSTLLRAALLEFRDSGIKRVSSDTISEAGLCLRKAVLGGVTHYFYDSDYAGIFASFDEALLHAKEAVGGNEPPWGAAIDIPEIDMLNWEKATPKPDNVYLLM